MKKLILALVLLPWVVSAQFDLDKAKKTQEELVEFYDNKDTSPIKDPAQAAAFEGLYFYPLNPDFCVEAKLVRTKKEKPFDMKTSSQKVQKYVKYGELHFALLGKKMKLDVFQNLSLIQNPAYAKHLFLPFTDATSGLQTYGGGRYLDLEIPKRKKVILDFNQAYHPYCAYTTGYSCPVTPEQNDLALEIKAGVKFK